MPSPDGGKLAFVGLDHVYTMDWPGGTPRRVTDADGDVIEAQPTWSPDGQSIAFVTWSFADDGAIYRTDAAGPADAPVRLTSQPGIYQNPVWSPDGERIVAVRGPASNFEDATGTRAFGAAVDLVWIPGRRRRMDNDRPHRGAHEPAFRRRRGAHLSERTRRGTDLDPLGRYRSEGARAGAWPRRAGFGERSHRRVDPDGAGGKQGAGAGRPGSLCRDGAAGGR